MVRAVLWLLIAGTAEAAETFSVIKSFGVATNVTGCNPACELVQDATGALYGTTGGEGGGTIFKVRPDGSGFQVLKVFTNLLDGTSPLGTLVLDGATLYGVTAGGGAAGWGTAFSMGADGSAFRVLKDFSSSDPGTPQPGMAFNGHTLFGVLKSFPSSAGIFRIEKDGTDYALLKRFTLLDTYIPRGRLLVSGGTLYGTGSPRNFGGVVFAMDTNGSGYTVLRTFSALEDPSGGLTLDGATLYGAASLGGTYGDGFVYRMSTNGTSYTVLKVLGAEFQGPCTPCGPPVSDGRTLYVATRFGGALGAGAVFQIGTNGGGYAMLGYFNGGVGEYPQSGLLLSGGMLYGTAYQGGNLAGGTVYKVSTGGSSISVLKHFGYSDSANPYGALLAQGTVLYGTTYQGGGGGRGTVYRVNLDGSGYALLKSFAISDGMSPAAGLVAEGNRLYGTTSGGGSSRWGTVFSVNPDGSAFAVVKSFTGGSGGGTPYAPVLPLDGFLYGTTYSGGASNVGAIYRLSTDGADYSILRSFQGGADGAYPYSPLIDVNGLLYGTSYSGGASNLGTVYGLKTDGTGYSVLKQFAGGDDGASPYSGLVSDGSMLYGTTHRGGTSGSGTVFKIRTNGTGYTVLKHLTSSAALPRASLLLNGTTLYGITTTGGQGNGVVFSMMTDGAGFTVLKRLSVTDGTAGSSGLVLAGDKLYGTTANGGSLLAGSVFGLTVLPRWILARQLDSATAPFGAMLSGIVGSSIIIEASSNLSNWVPLQTNVLGDQPLFFSDLESTNFDHRFYRARAAPLDQ